MKNQYLKILAFTVLTLGITASCETTELDLRDSPNAISPDQLDPDFLFNNILLGFNGFYNSTSGFSSFSQEVSRMYAMTGGGTYPAAYVPISFNGNWNAAYSSVLADINALEPVAEDLGLNYHLGVSRIMKGYVYMVLVDLFGDVPQTEALQGNDNLNPAADDDAAVYAAALQFFNEGIALLNAETGIYPPEDFYYSNIDGIVDENATALWITAAKTLKLRLLNTARLNDGELGVDSSAEINALLAENDLIDTPAEDLQFQYGTNRVNPGTRHPAYGSFYENDPGGSYVSNYYIWQLISEKGFDDPRLRYYFYRQDGNLNDETDFTLPCQDSNAPPQYSSATSIYSAINVQVPFCAASFGRGYLGRDHGDDGGLPPDAQVRTVPGVYPAGGLFDADQADDVQNQGTDGFLGGGINPIMLSSFVSFIKAESALTNGTAGDPRSLLEEGVRASIDKTLNLFQITGDAALFVPSQGNINNYVQFVLDEYDLAGSNDARLEIIMKEYHIAAYGNGIEVYNNYRRTGFPSNLQPTLEQDPGAFYNSALYPSDFVNLNVNATQKQRTDDVFWDTQTPNLN